MIILNERKSEENDNKNSFSLNFIFIGSIYLTINVTLFSLGLVGQKFLCKEKLSPEEQTFYFGFYSFPTERANCSSNPISLSIDMKIQYAVRDGLQKSINEFNAVGGAVVIMNISNGEIISLVSLPYFDSNKKLGPNDKYLFNMIT